MAKKLFLVLGNGFTIDFINHIDRQKDIDVRNLFRLGSNVPWPATGLSGFLSFKHCPNLWNLGARSDMSVDEAITLIENIITCVNVYASRPKNRRLSNTKKSNDIYIKGYKELLEYLKHLFIFYDKKITNLPDSIETWSWFKFLKYAANSDEFSEIVIVTYNYDVWLERLLTYAAIPFRLGGIESDDGEKIIILKPHGSISFTHNKSSDKDAYSIRYDDILPDSSPDELVIKYTDLDDNYLVSALIPPAGEPVRLNHTWANVMREEVLTKSGELTSNDELMLCGISYWHVDRDEIDDIFVNSDPEVDLTLFNPRPNKTLDAVLTSIFNNFVVHAESTILESRVDE